MPGRRWVIPRQALGQNRVAAGQLVHCAATVEVVLIQPPSTPTNRSAEIIPSRSRGCLLPSATRCGLSHPLWRRRRATKGLAPLTGCVLLLHADTTNGVGRNDRHVRFGLISGLTADIVRLPFGANNRHWSQFVESTLAKTMVLIVRSTGAGSRIRRRLRLSSSRSLNA